jgi:hypothetical protein
MRENACAKVQPARPKSARQAQPLRLQPPRLNIPQRLKTNNNQSQLRLYFVIRQQFDKKVFYTSH